MRIEFRTSTYGETLTQKEAIDRIRTMSEVGSYAIPRYRNADSVEVVAIDEEKNAPMFGFETTVYGFQNGYWTGDDDNEMAYKAPQINWPSIGSQSVADAETFARVMAQAIEIAKIAAYVGPNKVTRSEAVDE